MTAEGSSTTVLISPKRHTARRACASLRVLSPNELVQRSMRLAIKPESVRNCLQVVVGRVLATKHGIPTRHLCFDVTVANTSADRVSPCAEIVSGTAFEQMSMQIVTPDDSAASPPQGCRRHRPAQPDPFSSTIAGQHHHQGQTKVESTRHPCLKVSLVCGL